MGQNAMTRKSRHTPLAQRAGRGGNLVQGVWAKFPFERRLETAGQAGVGGDGITFSVN